MIKHCSLVCDTPAGLIGCELALPPDATIAQALEAARAQLGDAHIDWQAAVGIFGQPCARDQVPQDGDRIELYRPLAADPRAARRARVARGARSGRDLRRGRGT